MNFRERREDIESTSRFLPEEIEFLRVSKEGLQIFKTWEFHEIYHITNEEYNYINDEVIQNLLTSCTETIKTDKAVLYCIT